MAGEPPKPQSWWQTLPGVLTAVATIITAATGLIVALNQAGVLSGKEKIDSRSPAPPSITPAVKTASPPTSVDEWEKKLRAINIDLGDSAYDKEKVRGYLAGPGPEYRALALGCLQVIGNRNLNKTLHLDIIEKHYSSMSGGSDYLSADGNVNLERVKEAMVKARNDFYTDNATSFEEIVGSR
jgi:hypothetical protein